jgi:hypothetical protein
VPDEQAQQGLYKDAVYSMTSSARAINVGGIVMPSAFAVLRLITSSNFVGCSTGKSAGFAPLRILSRAWCASCASTWPCWNARLPSWKHHDAPARLHFRLTSFVLKLKGACEIRHSAAWYSLA